MERRGGKHCFSAVSGHSRKASAYSDVASAMPPSQCQSATSARAAYHNDGNEPQAGVIAINGTLYGTTFVGGPYRVGFVFKVTKAGKEKVLHSFSAPQDGEEPEGSLIYVDGALYGTTSAYANSTCVDFGCGTVFKVKL